MLEKEPLSTEYNSPAVPIYFGLSWTFLFADCHLSIAESGSVHRTSFQRIPPSRQQTIRQRTPWTAIAWILSLFLICIYFQVLHTCYKYFTWESGVFLSRVSTLQLNIHRTKPSANKLYDIYEEGKPKDPEGGCSPAITTATENSRSNPQRSCLRCNAGPADPSRPVEERGANAWSGHKPGRGTRHFLASSTSPAFLFGAVTAGYRCPRARPGRGAAAPRHPWGKRGSAPRSLPPGGAPQPGTARSRTWLPPPDPAPPALSAAGPAARSPPAAERPRRPPAARAGSAPLLWGAGAAGSRSFPARPPWYCGRARSGRGTTWPGIKMAAIVCRRCQASRSAPARCLCSGEAAGVSGSGRADCPKQRLATLRRVHSGWPWAQTTSPGNHRAAALCSAPRRGCEAQHAGTCSLSDPPRALRKWAAEWAGGVGPRCRPRCHPIGHQRGGAGAGRRACAAGPPLPAAQCFGGCRGGARRWVPVAGPCAEGAAAAGGLCPPRHRRRSSLRRRRRRPGGASRRGAGLAPVPRAVRVGSRYSPWQRQAEAAQWQRPRWWWTGSESGSTNLR